MSPGARSSNPLALEAEPWSDCLAKLQHQATAAEHRPSGVEAPGRSASWTYRCRKCGAPAPAELWAVGRLRWACSTTSTCCRTRRGANGR